MDTKKTVNKIKLLSSLLIKSNQLGVGTHLIRIAEALDLHGAVASPECIRHYTSMLGHKGGIDNLYLTQPNGESIDKLIKEIEVELTEIASSYSNRDNL